MLTLAQLIRAVKRRSPIGDINNTTDTVTSDLIVAINNKCWRVWNSNNWKFGQKKVGTNYIADTSAVTYGSTIGRLVALQVSGQQNSLDLVSLEEYLNFTNDDPDSSGDVTGVPQKYYEDGVD